MNRILAAPEEEGEHGGNGITTETQTARSKGGPSALNGDRRCPGVPPGRRPM